MSAKFSPFIYSPPPQNPEIIYLDDALIVVDKPAGLLSVPGRGDDKQDCLVSRLYENFPDALVIHRLDMATSGLLVLARNAAVQRSMSQLFQDRKIEKRYAALVDGLVTKSSGVIDLPLITDWPNRPRQIVDHRIGKPSKTRFEVQSHETQKKQTRLRLFPVTGRTHQLRVHLQAIGHPIVGDRLYNQNDSLSPTPRLFLHAERLTFIHPLSGQKVRFDSAVPF